MTAQRAHPTNVDGTPTAVEEDEGDAPTRSTNALESGLSGTDSVTNDVDRKVDRHPDRESSDRLRGGHQPEWRQREPDGRHEIGLVKDR